MLQALPGAALSLIPLVLFFAGQQPTHAAACAPLKRGELFFSANANQIAFAGSTVYVVGGDLFVSQGVPFNFIAVDISSPSAPVSRGYLPILGMGTLEAVDIAGNYAYVASTNGLSIIDVTNPANPSRVSDVDLTSVFSQRVRAVNDRAYVIGPGRGGFGGPARLFTIDVGAPLVPVQLGSYQRTSLEGHQFNWRDVEVSGNIAYVAAPNAVIVLDITNPAAPTQIGLFADSTIDNYPRLIARGTKLIAIAGLPEAWGRHLLVFDVSNPRAPRLVSKVDVGGKNAQDLEVVGNRALVLDADRDNLLFYDISNVENVTLVGTLPVSFGPYQFAVGDRIAAILQFDRKSIVLYDVSSCLFSGPVKRRSVKGR